MTLRLLRYRFRSPFCWPMVSHSTGQPLATCQWSERRCPQGSDWCLRSLMSWPQTLSSALLPLVRVDVLNPADRCVHSLSQRYWAILAASHRTPPPDTPPVVRAEPPIPWVPPLASELERLLMADAIGPANISHNLASE
jgi:hypothetical protein